MLAPSLISGDGRVDLNAPQIDSARHALAVFYSVTPQPVDHREAADSVMAKNDQGRAFVV
jgi:hypothetical protein